MPTTNDADVPILPLVDGSFSVTVVGGEIALVSGPNAVVMSSAAALELARQLTEAARGIQRA